MMDDRELSHTMRIDLIPDVPANPVAGKKKRIVVSRQTKKFKATPVPNGAKGRSSADQRFNEFFQNVYDAALITDIMGVVLDANVRAMTFFQYEQQEFQGLSMSDILSGADQALLSTITSNLQDERYTVLMAYGIRKDGSYFPSEVAISKLHFEKGEQLCFFIRDITVRRQSEEMLRTEHSAIQNSGDGIAIADLKGKLEYVNPAVGNMWGIGNVQGLVEQDVREFWYDREKAQEMINSVMADNAAWSGSLMGLKSDGSQFPVQISGTCNRNSDGEAVGMVFSFVDMTDRQNAEEAMRQSERQRVMLETVGAACHHVGQPATVLLANLGMIKRKVDETDENLTELVSTSIEAAEKLADVLHKLNTVTEYRTTKYLEHGDDDSMENRILEI